MQFSIKIIFFFYKLAMTISRKTSLSVLYGTKNLSTPLGVYFMHYNRKLIEGEKVFQKRKKLQPLPLSVADEGT